METAGWVAIDPEAVAALPEAIVHAVTHEEKLGNQQLTWRFFNRPGALSVRRAEAERDLVWPYYERQRLLTNAPIEPGGNPATSHAPEPRSQRRP